MGSATFGFFFWRSYSPWDFWALISILWLMMTSLNDILSSEFLFRIIFAFYTVLPSWLLKAFYLFI